jgi:CMP-N,N'-diacetyllegionaminic acid synthase
MAKKVLGFIPARGGSKGVPRKNIRLLSGKPLLAWTIEAAKLSGVFDRLIVSTDDNEIAEIARKYGADVPFLRPKELSLDTSRGIDAVFHANTILKDEGYCFDQLMLLQPTSPLRNHNDIISSLELLNQSGTALSVVSVCECEHSPLWANTIGDDLSMKDFLPTVIKGKSRQQLPQYYRLNGAIYVAEWEYLCTNKGFLGDRTLAYIMPQERSVDIDTVLDMEFAEFLLSKDNQ